ncbi:MAG: outer membrane beta-barrel protein [Bacteroidales bacterium]
MKRVLLISIFFLFLGGATIGQSPVTGMLPADRLMVDIFTDVWQNTPDGMSTNTINRGITISMMKDFPLGSSSFSFAAGAGFTGHNLYSDHYYTYDDTDGRYFDFVPIDETEGEIKKNKLSLNYLNVPLEIRFRTGTAPRTMRVTAGLRAGVLVNAHTKHHFEFEDDDYPEEIEYKLHQLDNIEAFRLGVTARVGYGRFNINAYMPLTNIFEGNTVEDMNFFSVGLTLSLY